MSDFDRFQQNRLLAVLLYSQIVIIAGLYYVKIKRREHRARTKLRKRLAHGVGNGLGPDRRRLNDAAAFFESFRMSRTVFEELLILIGPSIQKQITELRSPIPANKHLLLTLRYLATVDDQTTIAINYGVEKSTVNGIITNTCEALWHVLLPVHMAVPTESTWKEIAADFGERWDFPNCIGAIGGKHVPVRPAYISKRDFDDEDSFMMLLMADARCKITILEVGECMNDTTQEIFVQSNIGTMLRCGMLNIPQPASVSGALSPNATCVSQSRPNLPYVMVGDEEFTLQENLMCPFPQRNHDATERIFNSRLSRALIAVENVLGILAARWCFYLKVMTVKPKTGGALVRAACVLHNYLCNREASEPSTNRMYCPQSFADHVVNGRLQKGEWRNQVTPTDKGIPFHYEDLELYEPFEDEENSSNGSDVRNSFAQFFLTEDGKVPWQLDENSDAIAK